MNNDEGNKVRPTLADVDASYGWAAKGDGLPSTAKGSAKSAAAAIEAAFKVAGLVPEELRIEAAAPYKCIGIKGYKNGKTVSRDVYTLACGDKLQALLAYLAGTLDTVVEIAVYKHVAGLADLDAKLANKDREWM